MSRIKISPDLFLEQAELNRLQLFINEEGYQRRDLVKTKSFGIANNLGFKVITSSSNTKVKLNNALNSAIDSDGHIMFSNVIDDFITIPNDNVSRYICIRHKERIVENGTISIGIDGTITGSGTEFTKLLRGADSNYPSVIKLYGSNTGEYVVQNVVNDTNCVISGGSFVAETGLKYSVIGTFTPGVSVPTQSKNIFLYDSVEFFLVTSLSGLVADKEFSIAKVTKNAGTITELKDYRKQRFSILEANELYNIGQFVSPLIGIESIIWDKKPSSGNESIVKIAFGFRPTTYTIDYINNVVNITAGLGGYYKNSSAFATSDFDGWRLYSQRTGKYHKIVTSVKSGSTIICNLDTIDADYIQSGDTLVIVPDAEEIQFQLCDATGTQLTTIESYKSTLIKSGIIEIKIPQKRDNLVGDSNKYVFKWRHKSNYNYTQFIVLFKNSYLAEDGSTYTPSVDSQIVPLIPNPAKQIYDYDGDIKTFNPITDSSFYWDDNFERYKKVIVKGSVTLSDLRYIVLPVERGVGGRILEKGLKLQIEWRANVDTAGGSNLFSFFSFDTSPISSGSLTIPGAYSFNEVYSLSDSLLQRSNFLLTFIYLGGNNWDTQCDLLQDTGIPGTAFDGFVNWNKLTEVGGTFAGGAYPFYEDSGNPARISKDFDNVWIEGILKCNSSNTLTSVEYTMISGIHTAFRPTEDVLISTFIEETVSARRQMTPIQLKISSGGDITLKRFGTTSAESVASYIYLSGISYKIRNKN
jgi:hypothetical protein